MRKEKGRKGRKKIGNFSSSSFKFVCVERKYQVNIPEQGARDQLPSYHRVAGSSHDVTSAFNCSFQLSNWFVL